MKDQKEALTSDELPDESRRRLIKKAAYTAPVLVAMGLAAHSPESSATLGSPPDPPTSNGQEGFEDDPVLREFEEGADSDGD